MVRGKKRRWVMLAAVAFASLLPPAGQAAPGPGDRLPRLAWAFDLRHSPDLTPHTNVFLRVDGRRIPILRDAEEAFQTSAQREYKDQGIPARALTACGGWWAGSGDRLYVIRHGHSLIVFRREEDEQAPAFPWKRLKVIPVR